MKLLILAGDPSGDLHASNLIKKLKELNPNTKIYSVGGKLMKEESDVFLEDIITEGSIGFIENILKFPLFFKLFKKIIKFLDTEKPDVFIPVDFYGFNIKVAKESKKRKIKTIYFISPQLWATRLARIKEIKKYLDKVLTVFPFEKNIYDSYNVPCEYIGHPYLDIIQQKNFLSKDKNFTIGFFPGSRKKEFIRHFEIFINICKKLNNYGPDFKYIFFIAKNLDRDFYENYTMKTQDIPNIHFFENTFSSERTIPEIAVSCSGSVVLENALFCIPTIVVFKTSFITSFLAMRMLNVPYISMPNILLNERLFPELLQKNVTVEKILEIVLRWKDSPQELQIIKQKLLSIREILKPNNAYTTAAKIILQ